VLPRRDDSMCLRDIDVYVHGIRRNRISAPDRVGAKAASKMQPAKVTTLIPEKSMRRQS